MMLLLQPTPLDNVSDAVASQVPGLYVFVSALVAIVLIGVGLFGLLMKQNTKRDDRHFEFLHEWRDTATDISKTCHDTQMNVAKIMDDRQKESNELVATVYQRLGATGQIVQAATDQGKLTVAALDRLHKGMDKTNGFSERDRNGEE